MSSSTKSVRFASATRVTVTQQSSSDDDDHGSDTGARESDGPVAAGTSSGWSDAMNRLLNCQIRNKNFILAKAKKDRDVDKVGASEVISEFEVIKESGEKEVVTDAVGNKAEKEKSDRKEDVGRKLRQKATQADPTHEAEMNAIATRGVVQLFNAVNQQRFRISKKLRDAGPSETRKDRVLASVSKDEFLDSLKRVGDPEEEEQADEQPLPKKMKKHRKDQPEKLRFRDVFSDSFTQKDNSDG